MKGTTFKTVLMFKGLKPNLGAPTYNLQAGRGTSTYGLGKYLLDFSFLKTHHISICRN